MVFALDRRHAIENLQLKDGRCLTYKQIEGSFSNPNGHMAIHTLSWLCEKADEITQQREGTSSAACDLLELYCGAGTHTVALSHKFRK